MDLRASQQVKRFGIENKQRTSSVLTSEAKPLITKKPEQFSVSDGLWRLIQDVQALAQEVHSVSRQLALFLVPSESQSQESDSEHSSEQDFE